MDYTQVTNVPWAAINSVHFYKLLYIWQPMNGYSGPWPPFCKYGKKISESASIPVENNASKMHDLNASQMHESLS
jgi:hypothetical protein